MPPRIPDPALPAAPGAFARRRGTIVSAARSAFLDHGYEGASMDRIAATAGVTKKTLYNHFPGKASLFAAVLDALNEEIRGSLQDEDVLHTDDPAQGLIRFGHRFVSITAQAPGLEMYRLAITVTPRFPEFGESIYMSGTAQVVSALADYIVSRLHEPSGPEALQLARQLIGMLGFLVQSALLGAPVRPDSPDSERYIRDAVHTLLARARIDAETIR